MTRGLAAFAMAALLAGGCGAERTPTPAAQLTPAATVGPVVAAPVAPPTTTPEPTSTEVDAATPPPLPTPTTRVIGPVGPPSEAGRQCTDAGLVAAALDACLRYVEADCTVADAGDVCELTRDQLEVVLGTRVFPSDCDSLDDARLAEAPRWCSQP